MTHAMRIKDSFKKLKKVNTITEILEVDDIKFEISVLTRQEEIDSQAWSDQQSEGLSHVLKMDVARLSYAIKKVNDLDMEEFLEDPETKERIQRSIFLRQELLDLPSPLLDALIHKYNVARSKLREKLGMQKITLETLFEQAMQTQEALKTLNDVSDSERHIESMIAQEE